MFHYYSEPPFGPESVALTKNVMGWLTNGKASPKLATRDKWDFLGFDADNNVAASSLAASDYDVYGMWGKPEVSDADATAILEFVSKGGSLIITGVTRDVGAADYATKVGANKILLKMGTILAALNSPSVKEPKYSFASPPSELSNVKIAVEKGTTTEDFTAVVNSIGFLANENTKDLPEMAAIIAKAPEVTEKYNALMNNEEMFKKNPNAHSLSFKNIYPTFIMTSTGDSIPPAWDYKNFPGDVNEGASKVTKTVSFNLNTKSELS